MKKNVFFWKSILKSGKTNPKKIIFFKKKMSKYRLHPLNIEVDRVGSDWGRIEAVKNVLGGPGEGKTRQLLFGAQFIPGSWLRRNKVG